MPDIQTDPLVLTTDRLLLKTLDESHAEAAATYLSANRHFFDPWSPIAPDAFFTTDGQREKLRKDEHARAAGKTFRFYIMEADNPNQIIGDLAFSQIVRGPFLSCFLGYKMAQAKNGKGLMTEALARGVQFAFEALELHRIEANIMPHNYGSIRVVEKLSFAYEGLSPKYLKINGKWEDHAHYVLRNTALED